MSETPTPPLIATLNQSPLPAPQKSSWLGGCVKGCLISLIILMIIGAVTGYFGYKFLTKKLQGLSPTTSQTTLTIDSGTVPGFTSGQILSAGQKLSTGSDSSATISFPNGSEIRLDENTTLTLTSVTDNLISLYQTLGRSWTRVIKLTGANSNFEIETPTALATVRGTAFTTIVSPEESIIDTDDGQVEMAVIDRVAGQRKILQKLTVEAGFAASIPQKDLADLKAGRKQIQKLTTSQEFRNSSWYRSNKDKDQKLLDRLKNRSLNPLQLLNVAKTLSPADLAKIRGLAQKAQNLSPDQVAQIEALAANFEGLTNPSQINPQDIAQIMAIIDPVNFSDTAHWSEVISTFQKLSPNNASQNNSDLFNSLQNLPAIGIPKRIKP